MKELKLKTETFLPNNIHCIALNFPGVLPENEDRPLYFVKSNSAAAPSGSIVPYPKYTDRLWTEVELGIVVGKDGHDISPEQADEYVEGFVVCADVTCNNIHGRDHHLAYSKSRKNFCPFSNPIINLTLAETNGLQMKTWINGTLTQDGLTSDMIFGSKECLVYVSQLVELKKGDLIITGTPKGHEKNTLHPGDQVKHWIEKIGTLKFSVD